ncbi:hypothetical protein [Streptomyces sp. HUAS TT20]|uniref:hypothetical protein n=1 Tax=Streptomyces sp. HUAS TT20 TaxID=3447509 RepID=UPI0021D935C5|nr:hypothetical protein [Streptomyces sp. HUAS 15-9]UXY30291.1 hypothetical protein N8I87_29610 [Streptomyces sp. HUAS 15-9]
MLPDDAGGSGLKRGLEALKTFKKRVDTLLTDLEGSPGSYTKVAAHTLSAASLCGKGEFAEATGLHREYERVHERITSLSKSLALQIEAMQIAVHGADVGYDKLEDDLRRRFHEIRTEINEEQAEAHSDQKRSDQRHAKAGY